MSTEFGDRRSGWRTFLRWSGAATVVVVMHLAGAWVIARQHSDEPSAGAPAPAIILELSPLPVAPAAEPLDVPPGPEISEYQPEPVSETPETDTPVETEESPPPEPEIDLPEPAEPVFAEPKPVEPVAQAELQMPELPSIPEPAEAVLPPPPPPERRVEEKLPEPAKRPVRQSRRSPKKKQVRPQGKATMAPPHSQVAAVRAPAAPAPGVSSPLSGSPANWHRAMIAHLNRAKRYPPEARSRREEGVVRLSFSIDRSGRVTGYRIVGSSGSSALDREALAMIQRASPLPAPPPQVAGARIDLMVPVRFNID
ncbi:energy transducer TonB [Microvirga roseola]|uniref:energy transducer TonB n=1 Tax=Microvirga roseola TaxID=2883126 RepID=UPI001E5B0D3D|nr:energy transducer TonB [Microvirga roseola]